MISNVKTYFLAILSFVCSANAFSQGKLLKVGQNFPDLSIKNLINAPSSSISLSEAKDNKIYILNFWGTWCAPCIPEMDELNKLQITNSAKIQVVAISDEDKNRLSKYLQKKPTKMWLASDTGAFLYALFGINSVSQSAIIKNQKIVAIVKTHSINQELIDKITKGETILSDAAFKEKKANTNEDVFGVDSTLTDNYTVRGYMQGQQSSSALFNSGAYKGRRLFFLNSCLTSLFQSAYEITSSELIFYEVDKKSVCNFEDKNSLYCLDLLVKPTQKDSLFAIFREKLSHLSDVKARIEYRNMSVNVLTSTSPTSFNLPISKTTKSSYGFSGRGFDGKGISLTFFAETYLSNELGVTVNETGIEGLFDIVTNVELQTITAIHKSIADLGLTVTKAERKARVLVLYR